MRKFALIFLFLVPLFGYELQKIPQEPFEYINHWRQSSGLKPLTSNSYLKQAAYNHSLYLSLHNSVSHIESPSLRAFTGKSPSSRAVYAGYGARMASENIAKARTPMEGVHNLMTAIYHRFGFLSYQIDEIGISEAKSKKGRFFTYVMGNSLVDQECRKGSYKKERQFYTKVCKDLNHRIGVSKKTELDKKLLANSPDYVLYPYPDATGVPPVFYEEFPDPLPRYSMVGNPISIEFHPKYKDRKIKIVNMRLIENRARSLPLMALYKENDPNHKLTHLQFAAFPKNRLAWDQEYEVILEYQISEEPGTKQLRWKFHTQAQPNVIEVENKASYKLKPHKTYTLYFKKAAQLSTLRSLAQASYRFAFTDKKSFTYEIQDSLTIQVSLTGTKKDKLKVQNRALQSEVSLTIE